MIGPRILHTAELLSFAPPLCSDMPLAAAADPVPREILLGMSTDLGLNEITSLLQRGESP